ncbi:MAG: hypothetical protein EP330_17065 [Deltaproteobacteria bacterium]|nr:MAG: hypothetical protein EP330_17065 [Deltaproteobacteria bacterium]
MLWMLALACSQAPAPEAPPAPADVEPAPVEAPAPEVAATPPSAPTLPAMPTHCAEGETVHFACAVKGDKVVSLCGVGDAMQYRFGKLGAVELAAPAKPSKEAFGYAHEAWVRAEADAVRMVNEGVSYWLVDKIGGGAFGEGDMNNFTGVVVVEDGKELARLPCVGPTETRISGLESQLAKIGYLE